MTDKQHIFLNTIAYIANQFQNRTIDFHKLSKILYFAEQKHLIRFGSKLLDDNFIAMDHGPVPSSIYDLLKGLKYNPQFFPEELKTSLTVESWDVTSNINPDMDWISESEVMCIDAALEENKNLGFIELSNKSHDAAWRADFYMKTEKIARAAGASDEMINYINSHSETVFYPNGD